MGRETRAANEEVVRRLSLEPGDVALEIGFGPGRTLELAAEVEPDAHFDGIDASADMVRLASRRCARFISSGRITLTLGDSASLPYASGRFGKVFAVHTIYFWSDPLAHFREISRVLAPTGLVVIGFRERSPEAVHAFPSQVYRFYSSEEVSELLRSAGLVPMSSSLAGPHSPGVIIATARKE